MTDLIRTVTERGDLAHLALFRGAGGAGGAPGSALRELAPASGRFDVFVGGPARFNRRIQGDE